MHELSPIVRALAMHRPRRSRWRKRWPRAAVAVLLKETDQGTQVLLVERAHRPGDPWSGDMAFPGGRIDAEDESSASRAACRETAEEIGVTISQADGVGRLSDQFSMDHRRRGPMVISPFVYRWPATAQLELNHEIAGYEWVTLAWLAEPAHRRRRNWPIGPFTLRMPSYDLQNERQLWGLTLRMLDELITLTRSGR